MTRNSIIAVLFVALVAPAAGCRDRKADLSTVKGAFAAFVSIADRGAYNELYPILVKDVQAKIATTHDNVHKAVALIAQHYPPALRQQALADLGPDEVRNAADPAAHYGALVKGAGHVAMSVEQKMSSRLKRVDERPEGSGHFVVTTVSGASLEFTRGGDGLFYWVPDPKDVKEIHRQYLLSIERLAAVNDAVKTFAGAH